MVDQMLINLLRNAHEATEQTASPQIRIDARQEGDSVRITVTDNGCGISAEAMGKVFIPFYSTKSGGSGIGLSLCRQMMLLHKGLVALSSDGEGTRITLQFPV